MKPILNLPPWKNPLSLHKLTALRTRDWAFLVLTAILSAGFIHFDVRQIFFAKLGIPLAPGGEGMSVRPKLYVTEIYLLILSLLALTKRGLWPRIKTLFQPKKAGFWILLFMAIGILRAAPDLPASPLLVVRNLAFVWYLSIPLLIYLGGFSLIALETYAAMLIALGSAYFLLWPFVSLLLGSISLYWIPFLGLYAPLLFMLFGAKSKFVLTCSVLCWAMAIGFGYFLSFQRTNLLGAAALVLGLLVFTNRRNLKWKPVLVCAALSFGIIRAIIVFPQHSVLDEKIKSGFENPFVKSELNNAGLEIFRAQMWKDAANLFFRHPLAGIGFKENVVYRIFLGADKNGNPVFVPNDGVTGNHRDGNPISGPHNSYLNALARMGLLGALLLIIHAWLLLELARSGFFALGLIGYAQAIYAFFNVGLEGPVRSLFLLVAIGAGLILQLSKSGERGTTLWRNEDSEAENSL